ncbi:MAG: molybdopterin-dependent oxidoreductase, partial [Acidobacteria bacterium]|nr:molybdopterin-dependent oxidoreductase [Acidobacteriota bacterium]
MDRRDFIKVSAVTGASAALASCGNPEHQLIRFVPEETLVPGVAAWKPSLCTLCPAGCGVLVRVMEGDAEVVRNGRSGLIRMGLAKKIEGNPVHPISQGKLCARGQASVQIVYHPDRVRHPLKRIGPRASGQFQEISWDAALEELTSRLRELPTRGAQASLACLTRPLRGARRDLFARFLEAFGAPPPITVELFSDEVLRRANGLSFGIVRMPTFDLARSRSVICFGADLLGTWNSPVAQNLAYGEMRQGRPGERARLVQVESRMSQTGANADEWIPARPGTEGVVALGVAHLILSERLLPSAAARAAGARIRGWDDGLPEYTPEAVENIAGVEAARIVRLARQLATNRPAVVIVGGAPLAHTNGLFTALAVNALNALLGSVEQPGGFFFTPQPDPTARDASADVPSRHADSGFEWRGPRASARSRRSQPGPFARPHPAKLVARGDPIAPLRSSRMLAEQINSSPASVQALLVHDANPIFSSPPAWRMREALEQIPFIVSFGSFLDDTSVLADLVLPDHAPLEAWLDDVPESGTMEATVSLAAPAVRPLHDTRATPDVMLDIAHVLGGEVARALPWESFEAMLRARVDRLAIAQGSTSEEERGRRSAGRRVGVPASARPGGVHGVPADPKDAFWKRAQTDGGWWHDGGEVSRMPAARAGRQGSPPMNYEPPAFDGDRAEYPFHLLPYASQMLFDGSLAHLPWLQEIPEVLSTAMWGSWVEINPRSAERLNIELGDLVEVASPHGRIQAPALISPGVAPDIIAMPVGQGHEQFTRYAIRRGANPVTLLAPLVEPETDTLAWAATRVRVRRLAEGRP